MTLDQLPEFLITALSAVIRIFDDPPEPTAPQLFLGHFLYIFYIPLYLALLGARSLFVDFRGWLLPRFGRRLAEGINRFCTLLLAGFLPGWITTFVVWIWYPNLTAEQGLLAGYGVVAAFVVLYNLLVLRNVSGLTELLGRGYWHAVPLGGFFLGFYIGLFLLSAEALLAALTFLLAPLGAALILPFAASSMVAPRETGARPPDCALCAETVELAQVTCAKCDASYHPECWEHSEGCARKACRSSGAASAALG